MFLPAKSHCELFHQIESCRDNENRDAGGGQHANDHNRAQNSSGGRACAEANHNGADPKMKANEVIRMGRKRKRAPSRAASIRSRPFSNSALANSTIRIAFFAARPISTISPI